jgi:predicted MFS family arabinose efflux permease
MAGGRTIVAAVAVGVAVGAYLQALVGWPTFVAVAVGAVMAVFILLVAASLGQDDAAADAGWRAAAPDIAGRDPGRSPAERAADGTDRESRDGPG